MKTKIALLTILFLMAGMFATEVNAQQRGGQQGAGLQIGMLYADNMNLTDDQKAQIATLMVNRRAEMRAAREQMGRGSRDNPRLARAESATDLQSAIREILTNDQIKTYQANIQAAQENRQEAQSFMLKAQADAISGEAGLDTGTKEKVQHIVAGHLKSIQGQRDNRTAVRPDTEDRIQRLEARRDFENELQGVMSDEQFKTWMTEWDKMMPAMSSQRERRVQRGDGTRGRQGRNR